MVKFPTSPGGVNLGGPAVRFPAIRGPPFVDHLRHFLDPHRFEQVLAVDPLDDQVLAPGFPDEGHGRQGNFDAFELTLAGRVDLTQLLV